MHINYEIRLVQEGIQAQIDILDGSFFEQSEYDKLGKDDLIQAMNLITKQLDGD